MALTDNLVSCWQFESGALLTDAVVASANDLTNVNSVTSVAGLVGNASSFTAASSMSLTHTDNASLSVPATSFAIATWAKFTSLPTSGNTMTIAAKFEGGTGDNAWIFDITEAGGGTYDVRFLIRNNADSANLQVIKNMALSTATWYYFWGQFDTSGGTLGVAVNNSALTTNATGNAGCPDDTAPLRIGTLIGIRFFNGLLDQFLFYKGGLPTSGDRTSLYNAGAGLSYAEMQTSSAALGSYYYRMLAGIEA